MTFTAFMVLSMISQVGLMVGVLGIFLKGTGIVELWPHALALAALGVTLFLFALWRFENSKSH